MKASSISKLTIIIICTLLVYFNVSLISIIQTNSKNPEVTFKFRDTETQFIGIINNNQFVFEYISEEQIEEIKNNLKSGKVEPENEVLYDGQSTGLKAPSKQELNDLIGKKWIKRAVSTSKDYPPGASHDLSSQMYFPEVGNQQGQGSCAAWSITYYIYGYLEAKDYGWNASSGQAEYLMSPAWTYNKVATSNYGSWMSSNAQIMLDWGCATLATMPYDDTDYYSWGNESAWRDAIQHRAFDFYLMDFDEDNPNNTIDMIKNFILNETPITFTMHASEFNPSFSDGNYIMSSTEYDSNWMNHAQTIVGFNDTITDDGDVGAFKVVNSWGASFADGGYYWLTYECLKEIGLALGDFIIHLGVLTDRLDYEPSLVATWEFDSAPTRMNNIITVGVGDYEDPWEEKTPWYQADYSYSFPTFMAIDISEYYSYYETNKEEWFYLEVGDASSAGTISSFLIERYINGILEQVSPQSRDVPKTNPGYVITTFANLDHDLIVELETPVKPEINVVYNINTTVINNGIYNESNLNLYLYLGGSTIQSNLISELLVGENISFEYIWEPISTGRYNFTCYAPPLIEEEYLSNNIAQEVLFIPQVPLNNGLYINHSCSLGLDVGYSYVTYYHNFSAYYNVDWELNLSGSDYMGEWDVDSKTRIMENSTGEFYFGDGYHSPFWVFKEIELGDILPIASRYGLDYDFTVVDKIIYEFPGYGLLEVWILDQSEYTGGFAYYEKSTGILLNATFVNGIDNNDTYQCVDTNANFTYVFFPGEFSLSSDAGSPDKDGGFTLTWSSSDKAIDYSIYQYSKPINVINNSLISLVDHSTDLSFQLNEYSDGTYYFIVEARNDIGTILSNCIEVQIQIDETLTQSLILILGGVGMITAVGIALLLIHKRNTNRMV